MDCTDAHGAQSTRKVVIVTGGSKGIGEGCARVFVTAGWSVIICARGKEAGEALAAELSATGPGRCHFEPCDVTKETDIKNVIDRTVALFGRIDCLINNAGWHPDHRPIDDFSSDEFRELLNLNLISYFVGCKYALPYLRQTKGAIVNISSLVGQIGQEWATTYAATKGGITAFTKALAVDEMRNGVRVNAVLPGNIITPLFHSAVNAKVDPEKAWETAHSLQWAGRAGTAEEVGCVCLFLAGEQASYVTGIELIVSGGSELAYGIKWPLCGQIFA